MELNKPSEAQLDLFDILERICSVLSLLGCIFIIVTFCVSRSFHKPINRLVFYASFGNMMTNVATLMARTYVHIPWAAGCQFQAFLIQMFMPADAFWSLAMAVNVYLTFYYKFDAQKLRKMEVPYLLCCYGIPFIIAFVYIFIKDPVKGSMYGDATLWCWIQQTWDIWRIATFYGPVWVTICVTSFIYIRAGREIYYNHKKLHGLNYTNHCEPEPLQMDNPFSTKTTEVSVTSEIVTTITEEPIDLAPLGAAQNRGSVVGQQPAAYSVTISATPSGSARPAPTTSTKNDNSSNDNDDSNDGNGSGNDDHNNNNNNNNNNDSNNNNNNNSSNSNNNTTTTTTITATTTNNNNKAAQPRTTRRRAAYEANGATWQYTRCAILFFTAILVTWIPSTANRVYSVAHKGEISLPLEYIASFVLPLQGLWNAIIYVVTSWGACKNLAENVVIFFQGLFGLPATGLRGRSRSGGGGGVGGAVVGRGNGEGGVPAGHGAFELMSRGRGSRPSSDKNSETESMEELARVHCSAPRGDEP